MLPETISYDEAIERYKCTQKRLRRAIKAGEIDAYKPGREVRIDKESADKWFLSNKRLATKKVGGPRRGVRR